MKSKNKTAVIVPIVAVLIIGSGIILAVSRNNNNKMTNISTTQPKQNTGTIVVVAANTPTLSTLVTAVKAAGLVDTLQGKGPYTVFAPSNAAFNALPAGTLDTLLKPENVDKLKAVLTYHVVVGKVMASDLKDGQVLKTVQGGSLTVSIMDNKVYIIDAKGNKEIVEKADVNAYNGVVHVVSGVLLPN